MAIVGGGAFRAAFERVFLRLSETIREGRNETSMYQDIFDRLKGRLDYLEPMVREIQQSNRELGRPEMVTNELIAKMRKGKELVRKNSKLGRWEFFMRSYYAKQVRKLEESLCSLLQVELSAWNAVNGLETLMAVNDLMGRLKLVERNGKLKYAIPGPPDSPVGFDVPLKELKIQLLRQEVSMLVLTGPGGCGKTTMARMLCHDEEIKGSTFKDDIFFVPISKTPDLKVVVRELFLHKANEAPEFLNDEDAINQLQQLLSRSKQNHCTHLPTLAFQHNPTLLILDDVWSGSEFLLDMFAFRIPNYKVLVVSRTAFPRFSFKYELDTLNEENAMTLFRHSANLQDGGSYIPNGDIVKMIVENCGGFPIALKTVGTSLRGQPKAVWHCKENSLSNGNSLLDSHDDLLLCLQSSLDFKGNEIILKKCFKDLGSFPKAQRIHVVALIDMWSELYGLDDDGIFAIVNLHEISIRNMAKLTLTRKNASKICKYYNEDFVSQHVLLRQLAIHESSQKPVEQRKRLIVNIKGNNLPKWWSEQKQQSFSAHLLSISTDEMFSSSWCTIQLPKVNVLVLNFQSKTYLLPQFVKKMDKLKVLIATNHGPFPIELGNFQLLESIPHLKRIILEKVSIPSLYKAPIQFKSLEKISLFLCDIDQAFRNCTIQVSYAFPKLKEINIDNCTNVLELLTSLCNIICLKKLSISNCHKLFALPQEIGKLTNLEVLRLRSCIDLWELPKSIITLHELRILDISNCLNITKFPKHIGALCNLKELHMKGCLRLCGPLPPSIWNFEQLELVTCDEEKAKLWKHIKELLPDLEIKVAKNDGY